MRHNGRRAKRDSSANSKNKIRRTLQKHDDDVLYVLFPFGICWQAGHFDTNFSTRTTIDLFTADFCSARAEVSRLHALLSFLFLDGASSSSWRNSCQSGLEKGL
jgi:hypothetical protein